MPPCTLHLLSLHPSTTIRSFLSTLHSTSLCPILLSRVMRWIIPSSISVPELLSPASAWDLFLLMPSSIETSLPAELSPFISAHWSLVAGIPSTVLKKFEKRNYELLHPRKDGDVPALTGALDAPDLKERLASSTKNLELDAELYEWIRGHETPSTVSLSQTRGKDGDRKSKVQGAVSMLNLLSFHPESTHPGPKASYQTYGRHFASSVGIKRGGVAKIVGKVLPQQGQEEGEGVGWDEVAIAHYLSILHFGDMVASRDYQDVNQRYRVGSLRDTGILCLSELGVEGQRLWEKDRRKTGRGDGSPGAKL